MNADAWRRWVLAGVLGMATCVAWAQGGAGTARAAATGVLGNVVHVIDGDTVRFVAAGEPGRPITVRLDGIDAPEICQPWGPQAREALQDLVRDTTVRLVVKGHDDHGRTLGQLWVGDVDVGERLVRDGQAWSYRYQHNRGPFVAQERMAQALRRGLHATEGAVMPRDFRRRHGPCGTDAASAAAQGRADDPVASPATRAGAAAGVAPGTAATPAVVTRGNVLAIRGAASARRCDGRTRCQQMTSCEEATWFLQNCPGTQMDGDGDGIPCEQQWCTR